MPKNPIVSYDWFALPKCLIHKWSEPHLPLGLYIPAAELHRILARTISHLTEGRRLSWLSMTMNYKYRYKSQINS